MPHVVTEFLQAWQQKCGRNWAIVVAIAAGLVTFITLWNMAGPVLAEMRFWTARWETALIADKVYPKALADQIAITRSLEAKLEWLRNTAKAGNLDPHQWQEIIIIENAIDKSRREEEEIIREEAIFKLNREYR